MPEDANVVDRRKDLMAVVQRVVVRTLTLNQLHVELRHQLHEQTLDLEQGVSLAWTQRAKRHERMLHLDTILVELSSHKPLMVERL